MTRKEFFEKKLGKYIKGQALDKAVKRVIENQDRFYALLRSTNEPGIEDLISSIHNNSNFSGRTATRTITTVPV